MATRKQHKKAAGDGENSRGYCSVKEAASRADCSAYTIRRWVKLGWLKASRAVNSGSSRLRIDTTSLDELLAMQQD